MTSPSDELQALIYRKLTATTTVMALIDGVHDKVPKNPFGQRNAYVSFGPHDVVSDDADCIVGGQHSLQIDVWSRAPGGLAATKRVVDEIKAALHEADMEIEGNALVELHVRDRRVFWDSDGLTGHGVLNLQASIEEAT